jgi:hypothetical protein
MREWVARAIRRTGLAALGLLVLAWAAWGALLLAYAGPINEVMRAVLALAFCVASGGTLIAIFVRRWRWRALSGFAALCGMLVVFWSSLEPSGDREWQPQVAILPYATISGDRVTVHNIRNFDYRSQTDYTIAYYDKSFDLRQLRSVDVVTSYWAAPAIAHVFVSFGFADDDYLAVSVEVRYAKGQTYSPLKALFRQYELVYVVANERDVIRLRTNYRRSPPEDVYVYRAKGSVEDARRFFLEYMNRLNALRTQPEFYNTLTTNCATGIWVNDGVNPDRVPLSWKILASGYVPEYLYEEGRLEDMGLSFAELQRRAYVNARAQAADSAADFSQRIRAWPEVQAEIAP